MRERYYYLADDDDDDAKRRWRTNLHRLNINEHDCTAIIYIYILLSRVYEKSFFLLHLRAARCLPRDTPAREKFRIYSALAGVFFAILYDCYYPTILPLYSFIFSPSSSRIFLTRSVKSYAQKLNCATCTSSTLRGFLIATRNSLS